MSEPFVANLRKWNYLLAQYNNIAWAPDDTFVKKIMDEIIEEAHWIIDQAERDRDD